MGGKGTRFIAWIGIPVVLVVLLAVFWQWDWLIPAVNARASAALGRPVTILHLHVRFGRTIQVTADDVIIANPPHWPENDTPLASIGKLTILADVWSYLRGRGLILPLITLDKPQVYAAETSDGLSNFHLSIHSAGAKIGTLRITGGDVHIVMPKLKSDVRATIATRDEGDAATLVMDGQGTYAAQPVAVHMVGGALLSLRDPAHPWPVDLNAASGPTRLAIKGTLRDPLSLKRANVTIQASGPDLGLVEPLVGFPIPKTADYEIAGKLDFQGIQRVRVDDFRGRMGRSDIAGTIEMEPGGTTAETSKPVVSLDLRSNRVDAADLHGFTSSQPSHGSTPHDTPGQPASKASASKAKAAAGDRLLPDTPFSVHRLNWADIHLRYQGAHIQGHNVPLDNLTVMMDVVGGRITVHPMSFGVGKGRLSATADVTPQSAENIRARIDVRLEKLDVSRLMATPNGSRGTGSISGVGAIDATGNSVAGLLANGNGGVKMAMVGGDLSALLVDLSGLQFGNALLSALGMPQKTPVQCFVSNLDLRHGILDFSTMVLDTGEAITEVGGNIDLRSEKIDLALKSDAKHFSVGSLPSRLTIAGTLKDATIRPGPQTAARAGAVVGLAALFAPLAILPTIQFGTSEQEDARCGELLRQARMSSNGGKVLPPPPQQAAAEEQQIPAQR
jgi:uncharacterized protein involved in outer membrane biogenesis